MNHTYHPELTVYFLDELFYQETLFKKGRLVDAIIKKEGSLKDAVIFSANQLKKTYDDYQKLCTKQEIDLAASSFIGYSLLTAKGLISSLELLAEQAKENHPIIKDDFENTHNHLQAMFNAIQRSIEIVFEQDINSIA